MFTTVLLFIVSIALLILSHEFGHFIFAKRSGVKVEEFGFGFPPRLFGVKRGETLYSLNLLPFGGFVKIEGEEAQDGVPLGPRSFASKSVGKRSLILFAGILFNLLLALILFSLGFWIGSPMALDDDEVNGGASVVILEIQQGSPADVAGLKAGDIILSLKNGEEISPVSKIKEVQDFVEVNSGREITLKYKRGEEEFIATPVLRAEVGDGEGKLGIAMTRVGIKSYPLYQAFWEGAKTTVFYTEAIAEGIIKFFAGFFGGVSSIKQVSGPIGIAHIIGNAANFGFMYLLQLIAILSVNLAVLNIIPFPGLDGGRLLFVGIEAVKGSPVSHRVSGAVHTIGFLLLIFFMLVITYHDIAKFFS